jgi:signal transduction histidine kinase
MGKPVHILLVEDNKPEADLMLRHLTAGGIVHEARHVKESGAFIAAIRQECPNVILADYMLAAFDGLAALDIAKALCPDTPFLFVSDAKGEEVAIESLKRGAIDYVLKQRLERLAPAVRRALAEARQRREHKQTQEELVRRARELTVLNADLEQFAYAASHDLREPLRTISLFSRLLTSKYRGALDQQADEYLEFIEAAAKHMSALLEDLLIYTKLPVRYRELETVDLNVALGETLFLFRAVIQESRAVVTSDDLPVVKGNAAQLGLVLQNLISNALKYRGPDPVAVHVTAVQTNGSWVISVKDNGIGFEQNYAEQVFGLFKRLHSRDFPGTGLGLAICKRIVEVHGGRIWAESQPHNGSIFSFSLPVRDHHSGADVAQAIASSA